jgi:hypothetical protein
MQKQIEKLADRWEFLIKPIPEYYLSAIEHGQVTGTAILSQAAHFDYKSADKICAGLRVHGYPAAMVTTIFGEPVTEATEEGDTEDIVLLEDLQPVEVQAPSSTTRKKSAMQVAAETALDKGFSVFALSPGTKIPRKGTNGHLDATALPAEIEKLWEENPEYNPAVSCAASGLIVLDYDDGIPPSDLPKTYTVKTSRGLHVYYWGQTAGTKLYDENGKKVGELKSSDGYILAAGARHPSGVLYTVVDDSPVAEAPVEIIARITKKSVFNSQPLSLIGDKIPYGSHDTELTRIAGKLRHDGLEEEAIFNALVEVCEKRCEGYGADYKEMCRKIAHSISQKPVGPGLTVTLGGAEPGQGVQTNISVSVTPAVDPSQWRSQLKTVDELEDGDVRMIIDGFMPEGTIFFGGLSGHGKTWIVLSIVRALTTGEPFVKTFAVNEQIPVLYLIPESSGRAFKARLKKFGIPSDSKRFLCRTLSEGPTLLLNDPYILQCVREIKPIVVLDTAIRFSTAQDENAAMQNKVLADSIVTLRQAVS